MSMDDSKSLVNIKDGVIADLVKHCDEEYLNAFHLTDAEVKRLELELTENVMSDTYSLPMICTLNKCPMSKICPLVKLDKVPVGKDCPIESLLINKWKGEYIKALNVDWNDHIERRMVIEFVELDILNCRANSVLSDEGFIMENPVGVSEQTGEAIYRKESHIALHLKEIIYTRRSKLLKEMAATRESKLKFLADQRRDPANYAAKLRDKAQKLRESHEYDIIDADSLEIQPSGVT